MWLIVVNRDFCHSLLYPLGTETLGPILPNRINQKKNSPYITLRMVAGDPMDVCEWKFGDAVRPWTSVRMLISYYKHIWKFLLSVYIGVVIK